MQASDIKLFAAARMTDTADGGGRMSRDVIQDGVRNEVFPDISSVARARGALMLREVWVAAMAASTDALMDANVALDRRPADASVGALAAAAARAGETIAEFAARCNGGQVTWYGTAAVVGAVAATDKILSVDRVRAPLIPGSPAPTTVAGSLPVETVRAWVDVGTAQLLYVQRTTPASETGGQSTIDYYYLVPHEALRIRPGSVTGGSVTSVGEDIDVGATELRSISADGRSYRVGSSTLGNSTAMMQLAIDAPKQSAIVNVTSSSQSIYTIPLGQGTLHGSERITLSGSSGYLSTAENGGRAAFKAVGINATASISRSTGDVTLVLPGGAPVGTTITVSFAASMSESAVAAPPAASNGRLTTSISAGKRFAGAAWTSNQVQLVAGGGLVTRAMSPFALEGAYSAAGVITVPSFDGMPPSGWFGVQVDTNAAVRQISAALLPAIDTATFVVAGTKADGSAFTASPAGDGSFAGFAMGQYDVATGVLTLTFASPVRFASLTYTATAMPMGGGSVFADLQGLDPALAAAADGSVEIFRRGDPVWLSHVDFTTPVAATVGATISCGRAPISSAAVIDANGHGVAAGYSVDTATGVVTVTDVTGWAQPVTVRHVIDHLAIAADVSAGTLKLNRAPGRAFPAGSMLASALLLGTLQATVTRSFAQATNTSTWLDTIAPSTTAALAQYRQEDYPIEVTDDGAVTDRWALIFTSPSDFRLVGERSGFVATGTINADFAPINAATQRPLMTIRALGWGLFWASGNVLRFNTTAAAAPVWIARPIQPSAPNTAVDSFLMAVRGDV